jgi:hypothetical protein
MVVEMRRFNPDRALQRYDELAQSVGSIRAQRLTLTQGREAADRCPHCAGITTKVARIEKKVRTPVRRDGVIVNHAVVKVFERWELQCAHCSRPWPLVEVETKKPSRRRREPARMVDPSAAQAELLDLKKAFRRPPGFSGALWRVHLDLWRGLLNGSGYDALAEDFGPRLAAVGIGQGEVPSGRTVARMVRVARDLIESALEEQLSQERAVAMRFGL